MKSTTDEILQEGIKAHKNGDLQNAERLYREILQFSPLHPDANHNLGLIAVSTNNSHASLPLFKTALSVNPKVEQFWVSYIEALATEHYLEEAAVAVERAKSEGFVSHKVESLSKKLSVLNLDHSQKPSPSMVDKDLAAGSNNSALMLSNCQGVGSFRQVNPPEQKLRQLLVVYQKGQFRTAEKLARSLIQQFPHHEFGWKVLCNILGQTGRIVEGAVVARKSVDLSPQDADSRMSLANMLKELGELDDACACYRIAIQLRPGNPEVFNNLGVTLKLMGKVEEAEIAFKQAISFGPNYAEPRYNAGLLAQELSNFKDAVAFFSEAIKIKPTYTSAHNNLLRCLYLTGQKSPFFAQLDYLISNQVVNSVVGSFTDRAALKYGVKRPNVYCQDPLDYVVHIDLTSRCLFQEDFIDKISSFKKAERSSARTQSLVENGSQTKGNIFQLDGHDLTGIETIIRAEVEKFRSNFSEKNQGLIRNWPTEYTVYGWLVSMTSGGRIRPHIHDEGWLSGSIYINVPSDIPSDDGNLVVCLGDEADSCASALDTCRSLNVVSGSMVMFPSSLTHFTTPFESSEERVVLAFDIRSR